MRHQTTNKHYKHTHIRKGIKPIPSIPPDPVYRNHNTYTDTHECTSLKYPQTPNFIIFPVLNKIHSIPIS